MPTSDRPSAPAEASDPRPDPTLPLLGRLAGQETEYAIHWVGSGPDRPRRQALYDALDLELRGLVLTQPGRRWTRGQRFTAYGGSYANESIPTFAGSCLLEAATPECRGPITLLTYQKMQDELVQTAAARATRSLRPTWGQDGELVVLRNAIDAEANRYGPQENYEVELASGPARVGWLVGLGLLTPIVLLSCALAWLLGLVGLVLGLGLMIALTVLYLARVLARGQEAADPMEAFEDRIETMTAGIARVLAALEQVVLAPAVLPFLLLLRAVGWRKVRRELAPFLLSRMIFTGAGSIGPDGTFHLSEKGRGLRGMMRASGAPSSPTVFDTGNLLKRLGALLVLDGRGFLALTARRQRLQLGLSDANMCEWAELARIGTTLLVLDLVEDGAVDDVPIPARPLQAFRTWNRIDGFRTPVPMRRGPDRSALDLQRFYLDRARTWLDERVDISLEAKAVVEAWSEALELLELDAPIDLGHPAVGRIDWITKWALIEHAGRDASAAVRKKIDLKYHQLGTGYFAELARAGRTLVLVDDEARRNARETPPEATPAAQRGRLIRALAQSRRNAVVSWDGVRIGGRLGGRLGGEVIDLAARRPKHDDDG